jgi:hypothetical protein
MTGPGGSTSRTSPKRISSAAQMRASEESETELRPRSSWLMNPLVNPVAAASRAMVSPRSRRTARNRSPT